MKVFTLPLLAVVVVVLVISTLYLNLYYPDVYVETSKEMIKNGSFDEGLAGWSVESPEIVAAKEGTVMIGNDTESGSAYVSQEFSDIGHAEKVRFSGRIATENIEKGKKDYCLARLILVSVDSAGEELWFLPHTVVALEGSHDFADYSKIFTIFDGIRSIKAKAGKSCSGGIVKIDSVSMAAVEYSDSYKTARLFLLLFWIILALVTALKIVPIRYGNPNFLLFIFFVVAALAGTLHSPEWFLQIKISTAAHDKKQAQIGHTTTDKKPVTGKVVVESWTEKMRQMFKRVRAFGHGFVFFGLSVFAFRTWRKNNLAVLFVSLLLFAVSTETMQLFADGRSAKLMDAGINISGVVLGLMFARTTLKGSL